MENASNSTTKVAMTYGLYLGLISIAYSVILYVAGQVGNEPLGYVAYLFTIGVLIWAMLSFRDKINGGFMTYGQGVGLGFKTALFGGILSSIFTFILMKFIDPGLVDMLVEKALEKAIQQNPQVESQIDMVEKMTRMFLNPTAMLLLGIVFSAIGGIIISLILAAIFKKDKPLFVEGEAQEAQE